MASEITDAELEAYLEEALAAGRMAEIEQSLRDQPDLDHPQLIELADDCHEQTRWENLGRRPSAIVTAQLHQFRRRLHAFCQWQSAALADGWRIRDIEYDLDHANLNIADCRIRGRVDRVDEHPEFGLRIIDFKTSDRAQAPHKVHFDRNGD